jgi:peptidoglycan/xylan/chitin deacetylase (PgdA/CDA1 family)
MPRQTFQERLALLKQADCNVLPLETALNLLHTGKLPPRAIAITFDDGFHDFGVQAWPHLRHFNYPVTVYLTSYYAEYNMPVFDLMCPYLLWKARGQRFSWPEMGIEPVRLDVVSSACSEERIKTVCLERRLDGPGKNAVLRDLAQRLGLDFDDFCRRRLLHIMTGAEVTELARQGVDFQLHGHWHRVSRSREGFWNELQRNKLALARFGVSAPTHYCYPTGLWLPEFPGWLAEFGVRSAVTCQMGLASMDSNPYLLPRLLDTPGISAGEFSAWLSGLASCVPRRENLPDPNQLTEKEVPAPKVAPPGR